MWGISLHVIALTLTSHAQVGESTLRAARPEQSHQKTTQEISLGFSNSEYVSSHQTYFRDGAQNSNRTLSLGVNQTYRRGQVQAHLRGRNDYSLSEEWNYPNVFDAYASWSNFSIGRQTARWNEWEDEWGQGLYQPRYMQNKLRPEFAGLTGLFYRQDLERFNLTLGFLPVHVPDFGAHFHTENDKFVSRNPWFDPPASQFEFREERGELRYTLDKPSAAEVLGHPGAVAKFEFNEGHSYFGRVAGAYKPMPQFFLGFPWRGLELDEEEDSAVIRLVPRVAYHTVISHDSVVKLNDWTLSASLAREVPSRERSPADLTAKTAEPAWITSFAISRPLENEGPAAARVSVGFFKVQGGDAPDAGEFAGEKTLFERRYQYLEAYSLTLHKPWRGSFVLDTQMRLLYDRLQNGGVISFSAGKTFAQKWHAHVDLDFLGLLAGSREITDGFLSDYRANDRVGLGVNYVF